MGELSGLPFRHACGASLFGGLRVSRAVRGVLGKGLKLVALRVWVVGLGLVWASGGGCLSGMLWFPLWCAYVSLWLGGLVCGSCVICGFRASFVWLRLVVMRSRSTLCEVPLEDIWRRPVPSSKAGRGEVCLVWVVRG